MAAYLLLWNPKLSAIDFSYCLKEVHSLDPDLFEWSAGRSSKLRAGDRVFIMRLGKEPKGIFASGTVVHEPRLGPHYAPTKAKQGKKLSYVDVQLDGLSEPVEGDTRSVLALNRLAKLVAKGERMHWLAQQGGVRIPPKTADNLERAWTKFLGDGGSRRESNDAIISAHEAFSAIEGRFKTAQVMIRSRNATLRRTALDQAKGICDVCRTDYGQLLGGRGLAVLEVHHLKQLATMLGPAPIKTTDLAVLCANCHILLHRASTRLLTPSRLRQMLEKSQSKTRSE